MKLSSAFVFVSGLVFALAGCSGGANSGGAAVTSIPNDGIELKLAGKAGDKERVETLIDMNMEAPKGTPGAPPDGKMSAKITLIGEFEIQSVKDGKVTYKLKVAEAKMGGNMPANPAFVALKGKSGTLVYDESGKFLNSAGELGQAEQMFSSPEYPKKKLKKGDTWEQNSTAGGTPTAMVNKLEGMEEVDGVNCVVITSTLKDNAMMKMTSPGKTWINPATGRPVKATIAMTMDMGAQGKATMSMTMRKLS